MTMLRSNTEKWAIDARNIRTRSFVEYYGNAHTKKPAAIMRSLVRQAIRAVRGGKVTPPLVPEEFFEHFRIRGLIPDDNAASAAQLLRQGDGFSIVIASGNSEGRRNFSVFHEMAHTYFENAVTARRPRLTQAELKQLQLTRNDEERLCDLAASEFLFPRELFKAELGNFTGKWTEIARIADRFGASFEATARRIDEAWSGDLWIQKWSEVSGTLVPSDLCCTGRFRLLRDAFTRGPFAEIVTAARDRRSGERLIAVPALNADKQVSLTVRPWRAGGALSILTITQPRPNSA